MSANLRFDCEAVLFDCDGVLVDSALTIDRSWTRWARAAGLDPTEVLSRIHGRRAADIIHELAPHLSVQRETDWLLRLELSEVTSACQVGGASRLLAAIPPGRWALVTSGARRLAEARLHASGLPLPTVSVTAEDVDRGKPDPESYRLAALRLGADPARCIAVEDAPTGIEAARRAGMRVIGVATTRLASELVADVVVASLEAISVSTVDEHVLVEVAPGQPEATTR